MLRISTLFIICVLCMVHTISAQQTLSGDTEQEIIETIIEALDEEADFNLSNIYDNLSFYYNNPLNLNNASLEELNSSSLFSDFQSRAIIAHREQFGAFIDILELQAIDALDLATIKRVIPFVQTGNTGDRYQVNFDELFTGGNQEFLLRYDRFIEEKRGFALNDEDPTRGYLGDPGRVILRYRYQYEQNLSFGFTAEKDPGEPFFEGANNLGFDYYSGHLFGRRLIPKVKTIAIGDYHARIGQGLIINNGFAPGKSAFTTDIKRGGYALRPYRSLVENLQFRGIASEIEIIEPLTLLVMYSQKKRDGNGIFSDQDSLLAGFTSLQISGNHRTQSEIDDKGILGERLMAASLRYEQKRFQIAAQFAQINYDQPLTRAELLANQFNWSGDELQNVGVDYTALIRNIHLYGEWAHSIGGGHAILQGASIGLSGSLQLALLYRDFDRNYWSVYSAPFSESGIAINERGLYTGLRYHPHKRWTFSVFTDVWRNDWLRFGLDAPRSGADYFIRARYYVKRKTEVYLQYRNRSRTTTPLEIQENTRPTAIERRQQFRIQLSHKFNKALEWRNRAEWSWYDEAGRSSNGIMVYSDILYRPLGSPFSFTARYAVFDTDDFDSRIFAFENDILNAYSIPAFSGAGTRYYINIRYRPFPKWTYEFRYENLHLPQRETIGSGLEEIEGSTRSRIRAQAIYRF